MESDSHRKFGLDFWSLRTVNRGTSLWGKRLVRGVSVENRDGWSSARLVQLAFVSWKNLARVGKLRIGKKLKNTRPHLRLAGFYL